MKATPFDADDRADGPDEDVRPATGGAGGTDAARAARRLRRRSAAFGAGFLVCIAAWLFAPLTWHASWFTHNPLAFGPPAFLGADTWAYWFLTMSLVHDADLDVQNNYEACWRHEKGHIFRITGFPHIPTIVWYDDEGKLHQFEEIYETDHAKWHNTADYMIWSPGYRPGKSAADLPPISTSQHMFGLAVIAAPFVWPFADSPWSIQVCIGLAWVATVLTAVLYYLWVRGTTVLPAESTGGLSTEGSRAFDRDLSAMFSTTALALGTPAWFYAGEFLTEPFLALLYLGAYFAVFRRNNHLLAGLLLGLAMWVKPTSLFFILPLTYSVGRRGGVAGLVSFGFPVFLAGMVLAAYQQAMLGHFLRSPMWFKPGDPLVGTLGILFDATQGALTNCPVLAVALAAWPWFVRRRTEEAAVIAVAVLLHFGLIVNWFSWDGAWCYGPRYFVPVMPLLFLPLAAVPWAKLWRSPRASALRPAWVLTDLAAVVVGTAWLVATSWLFLWAQTSPGCLGADAGLAVAGLLGFAGLFYAHRAGWLRTPWVVAAAMLLVVSVVFAFLGAAGDGHSMRNHPLQHVAYFLFGWQL